MPTNTTNESSCTCSKATRAYSDVNMNGLTGDTLGCWDWECEVYKIQNL